MARQTVEMQPSPMPLRQAKSSAPSIAEQIAGSKRAKDRSITEGELCEES
jgi:hypothetical protein